LFPVLLAFAASVLAGAVAAVAGFGIGSLLTPLLAAELGTKLAVAAVSVPHFAGTALRLWLLRAHVDRRVLWGFGLTSGAGGLTGALLRSFVGGQALSVVFAVLLMFAGVSGLTGLSERMRFSGWLAWIAGAASGLLGGLVGNQGGIRSAAMLGFDVPKTAFVATATAAALMVDVARLPVYVATQGKEITHAWPVILNATVGVLIGTVVGGWTLRRVPDVLFRRVVSAIVFVLGVAMLRGGSRP